MTCDNPGCGAKVILPSTASGNKHFNHAAECLDLMCPACDLPFSVSIFKLEWLQVDDLEFTRGFVGGKQEGPWHLGRRRKHSPDRPKETAASR
jgi:hypothetical protein